MRNRAQERLEQGSESQPQGKVPTPITGTKVTAPQVTLSQSTESPVPLDTDTEDAYKAGRGGRSPRHRASHTPQSSHLSRSLNGSNQDVRRAFAARRAWPILWEGSPARPGEEEAKEEPAWADSEFMGGGSRPYVGKLGKLLGGFEEERGAERARTMRRVQIITDDFVPEEEEDEQDYQGAW